MGVPTFAELLTIPTQKQILDGEVLALLKSDEFKLRVTDWTKDSVSRAYAFIVSAMRLDVRKSLAGFVAAGFEDYAFGFVPAPGGIDVTSFAPIIAWNRYGLKQIAATFTKRRFTVTNTTATPYGPIPSGNLVVLFPSGNRYVLDEEISVPASGAVQAIFRSYYANDSKKNLVYNDPSDSPIVLVTTDFGGLAITNPSTTFSEVAQSGSGVGTVTPSGAPVENYSVMVRVDTTGQAADIAWSTSLDGAPFVPQSGASVVNLGGSGITITLANNGGDPAFAAGTTYYFSAPGSDVTSPGRDLETPQELGTRCRNLLPNLAVEKDGDGNFVPKSPTQGAYDLIARQFSDQVKSVFVGNGTVNNEVIVCVAGQGALLPPATLAGLQTAFRSRNMITDYIVVTSPVLEDVELGNLIVTVQSGMREAAQRDAQRALQLYFGGVDGKKPLNPNGRIEHGHIGRLLLDCVGVIRINDTTFTINGVAGDLQLPTVAGEKQMARWQQQIATVAIWVEG